MPDELHNFGEVIEVTLLNTGFGRIFGSPKSGMTQINRYFYNTQLEVSLFLHF
jgi:hypothetical protein